MSTTLQLAEAIAYAVLEDAYDSGDGFSWEHSEKRAPAVFRVLREHDAWFCRVKYDEHGTIELASMQQMELF